MRDSVHMVCDLSPCRGLRRDKRNALTAFVVPPSQVSLTDLPPATGRSACQADRGRGPRGPRESAGPGVLECGIGSSPRPELAGCAVVLGRGLLLPSPAGGHTILPTRPLAIDGSFRPKEGDGADAGGGARRGEDAPGAPARGARGPLRDAAVCQPVGQPERSQLRGRRATRTPDRRPRRTHQSPGG